MRDAETVTTALTALYPDIVWTVDQHSTGLAVCACWPAESLYAAAMVNSGASVREMADAVLRQERRPITSVHA